MKLSKLGIFFYLFFLPFFSYSDSSCLNPAYNAGVIHSEEETVGYYAYGSLLYMQALENNLSYAVSSSDPSRLNPPLDGIIFIPNFDWNAGIELGVGFYLPTSLWSIQLNWMHYIAQNNATTTSPPGGSLFMPESIAVGGSSICSKAFGDWGITFNQWFLTLSRESVVHPRIVFTYYWGLSSLWIKQSFRAQYDQVVNNSGGQGNTRAQSTFNSWGIGPSLGLNIIYEVGEGFRLFSRGGASLFYSQFYTKKEINNPNLAASLGRSPQSSVLNVKQHIDLLKPNTEFSMGFGWGSFFHNNLSFGFFKQ